MKSPSRLTEALLKVETGCKGEEKVSFRRLFAGEVKTHDHNNSRTSIPAPLQQAPCYLRCTR